MSAKLKDLIRLHGRGAIEAALQEAKQEDASVPAGQILCHGCKSLRPSRGIRGQATSCPNGCISPLPVGGK